MKRTRRTLALPVETGMRRRLSAQPVPGSDMELAYPATPDLFPTELEAAIDLAVAEINAPQHTPSAPGRSKPAKSS